MEPVEQQVITETLESFNRAQLTKDIDRFTARLDVYWENLQLPMVGNNLISSCQLVTHSVEPYVRKFKATTVPRPLSLGDILRENVGYILIVNLEGTRLEKNPTLEEQADIDSRIVLFDNFEIHPYGMFFFGRPRESNCLTVTCLHGEALLQTYVFPR